MKLKFLSDAYYNGELKFQAGTFVELDDSEGFASRWLKRNLAVEESEQIEIKELLVEPKKVIEEVKEEVKSIEKEIDLEDTKLEKKGKRPFSKR